LVFIILVEACAKDHLTLSLVGCWNYLANYSYVFKINI
jgi:hypothetical protein